MTGLPAVRKTASTHLFQPNPGTTPKKRTLPQAHRGLAALSSEAVAAGHQVISVWRNIAVGLDVLLGWKSVGYLPCPTVPHPAHIKITWGMYALSK